MKTIIILTISICLFGCTKDHNQRIGSSNSGKLKKIHYHTTDLSGSPKIFTYTLSYSSAGFLNYLYDDDSILNYNITTDNNGIVLITSTNNLSPNYKIFVTNKKIDSVYLAIP